MTRHTVYVALTFDVDDEVVRAARGAVPMPAALDVELIQRLLDAVEVHRLARAGVTLVSPAPPTPADAMLRTSIDRSTRGEVRPGDAGP